MALATLGTVAWRSGHFKESAMGMALAWTCEHVGDGKGKGPSPGSGRRAERIKGASF